MIGNQLRSEYADIIDILYKNIDLVKDLYFQCLSSSLDEIEPGESHFVFCTIIAVSLLGDYDKIAFPLNYNPEDEDLIERIANSLDLMLNIEAMADKGLIKKKIIDGETYFTA
jgi:hypothetical protein